MHIIRLKIKVCENLNKLILSYDAFGHGYSVFNSVTKRLIKKY